MSTEYRLVCHETNSYINLGKLSGVTKYPITWENLTKDNLDCILDYVMAINFISSNNGKTFSIFDDNQFFDFVLEKYGEHWKNHIKETQCYEETY